VRESEIAVNLDPNQFFIGLMDFFCVLLPGALLTYLLMGEVGPVVLGGRYAELADADQTDEWLKAEQAFRLYKSLRVTVSETATARTRLAAKIAIHDWDLLLVQMNRILQTEGELAKYINYHFEKLAYRAEGARRGDMTK
jgi:hypothetical protein